MNKLARTSQDKWFDLFNYAALSVLIVIVIYPLYFVLIASFSDPNFTNAGKVLLFPKGITLKSYELIFADMKIWIGYRNSLVYTIVGTLINLAVALPAAYAFSRRDLKGGKVLIWIFLFTMYFNGGMIPTYLLIKNLGMLDTIWSLVLPNAVIVYYMLIARTFFATTIPDELLDSSRIDGASDFRFFLSVVLPLSKAIVAVLALYHAIIHWNSYFNAMLYISSASKQPLQIVLRSILMATDYTNEAMVDSKSLEEAVLLKETVKYSVIIVASIPVLLMYPFVQKYFIKGVMIGAVKG
ncbi:carbohydrate ABC transporter permease [Paenibacillus hemerocallicola]|uniref:Carbohydrate ABC transporter permease n=1 Tax=Paenibacillus hemerocallicola TaxID=1172614 RepID=A0A5C4TAK7_9BACL|nr:carbohydrate ABC transporter permease [Paenibacillus hemerocallicola]TNJ66088.1 carbohydrate ABC transporter permease [Paenibacillus hemerocallicola]